MLLASRQPDLFPPAAGGSRIAFAGGNWFLVGFNYPWNRYSYDFSSDTSSVHNQLATVNSDFADLAAHGSHVVRWFIFAKSFLSEGGSGLDASFFQSFDDVLAIAHKNNIYLIPCFIDQAETYSQIFTVTTTKQSFFDDVLKPILQRYGHDSSILAWSPVNEPDYVTSGVDSSDSTAIPYQTMKDFMSQFTRYVHLYTNQQAAIDNGPLHFTHFWSGLGFDFYMPHWYNWMNQYWPDSDPLTHQAASYNLDKPIVLGELPSGSTQGYRVNMRQMLDTLSANGYAGALFWSMKLDDASSDYAGTKNVMRTWAQTHNADVDIQWHAKKDSWWFQEN
jgi:hypothetical protein